MSPLPEGAITVWQVTPTRGSHNCLTCHPLPEAAIAVWHVPPTRGSLNCLTCHPLPEVSIAVWHVTPTRGSHSCLTCHPLPEGAIAVWQVTPTRGSHSCLTSHLPTRGNHNFYTEVKIGYMIYVCLDTTNDRNKVLNCGSLSGTCYLTFVGRLLLWHGLVYCYYAYRKAC